MPTDFYWEGLFDVIEKALSPRKGKEKGKDRQRSAPPSKRVAKRKPKPKTRKRPAPKAKRKNVRGRKKRGTVAAGSTTEAE